METIAPKNIPTGTNALWLYLILLKPKTKRITTDEWL
jgi:hypothetical protein